MKILEIIGKIAVVFIVLMLIIFGCNKFIEYTQYNYAYEHANRTAGRLIEYESDDVDTDWWENSYYHKFEDTKEGRKLTLISLGRDGLPKTEDDITIEKIAYNNEFVTGSKSRKTKDKQEIELLQTGLERQLRLNKELLRQQEVLKNEITKLQIELRENREVSKLAEKTSK